MTETDPNSAQETMALRDLLTLSSVGGDSFEAPPSPPRPVLFGGQMMGQALAAAIATIPDDQDVHNFQGLFLRPGISQRVLRYDVERLREGASSSNRTVRLMQDGHCAFHAVVSSQKRKPGLDFGPAMPNLPDPETLRTEDEVREEQHRLAGDRPWVRDVRFRPFHFELRPVQIRPFANLVPQPARYDFWFRPRIRPFGSKRLERAALVYFSDMLLLSTTMMPHGVHFVTHQMHFASLNHDMWFHAAPDFDDWMLCTMEGRWTGEGRGLAQAQIFNRSGELVATVLQEGVIRLKEPR